MLLWCDSNSLISVFVSWYIHCNLRFLVRVLLPPLPHMWMIIYYYLLLFINKLKVHVHVLILNESLLYANSRMSQNCKKNDYTMLNYFLFSFLFMSYHLDYHLSTSRNIFPVLCACVCVNLLYLKAAVSIMRVLGIWDIYIYIYICSVFQQILFHFRCEYLSNYIV